MAIKRKGKEPSAGTDESEDHHQEDGGPSEKRATQFLNVKSPKNLTLPRSGSVLVVTMIVRLEEREETARILLDTGSTVPLLSQNYAKAKRITLAKQQMARPIQDYAGEEVEGAGLFYTAP